MTDSIFMYPCQFQGYSQTDLRKGAISLFDSFERHICVVFHNIPAQSFTTPPSFLLNLHFKGCNAMKLGLQSLYGRPLPQY